MGDGDFRSRFSVDRAHARGIVMPIVRIDKVEVVTGLEDPVETGLPSDQAGYGVVLEIAGDRDPRTELAVDDAADDSRRKAAFGQLNPVPLSVNVNQ